MKIAIPSNDEKTIARHFGKTKGFVICEIENENVLSKTYLPNTFTGHAKGAHDDVKHKHHHAENEEHKHHQHSHSSILNAIGDCDAVVAGGMGQRLYNDFSQHNIQVFVTQETDINKALALLQNNSLDNNTDKCCNH